MTIWFTSDHHFGHTNIIKYTNRPFKSVEEMDEELISRWNEVVSDIDVVYHLGDFTLGNYKVFKKYRSNLKGRINIVPGGHDSRWLRDEIDIETLILPPLVTVEEVRYKIIVLCHYPMLSWDRSHYGSIHLHGHSHGTISNDYSGDTQLPPNQEKGKRMDVGVDTNNFYPYSLDEILERLGHDKPEKN